jgi:hypothetical protein
MSLPRHLGPFRWQKDLISSRTTHRGLISSTRGVRDPVTCGDVRAGFGVLQCTLCRLAPCEWVWRGELLSRRAKQHGAPFRPTLHEHAVRFQLRGASRGGEGALFRNFGNPLNRW